MMCFFYRACPGRTRRLNKAVLSYTAMAPIQQSVADSRCMFNQKVKITAIPILSRVLLDLAGQYVCASGFNLPDLAQPCQVER